MKLDALKQYAKLRQALIREKNELEARLSQINEVLGGESTPIQAATNSSTQAAPSTPARRGRKPRGTNAMSLREAVVKALANGPLARKELAGAVEATGYVFTTKNPLNSIGGILYAKNGPIKSKGGKFYVAGGAAAIESSTSNGSGVEEAPAKQKKGKRSAAARARMAAAQKAS